MTQDFGDALKNFRKMALNTAASDIRRKQINILLCGPPGHGKSSTGNSILRSRQFAVFSDGDTDTTTVELKSTMYEHYKVKLVDCPPAPRQKPTNVKEVFKFCKSVMPELLKVCPKGFHAAVIVLKYGSFFHEEEGFVIAMLKEVFGEKFIEDHCICVISNGDTFRKVVERSGSQISPQDLNNWCRKQDPTSALGRIFTACKYRCVLFDNCTNVRAIRKEQLRQLMSMIVDSWSKAYLQSVVSVNPNMRIKADIHILIETASSWGEYQSQLKFIINHTSSYKMNPDTVKVCVMIFGKNDHVRFDFALLESHQQLTKTLLRTPFLKPSSGTDKALKFARQESFSQSGGTRYGVQQVALMLTEGHSTDERMTVEEADKLKSSGAEIIVVGVGSVDRKILEVIASDPTSVYISDSYHELEDFAKEVAQKTAEKAPEFKSTADILFILDSSSSISPQDYQKQLDFVVYLTKCFNIGKNEVLFSVMVFSSYCKLLFDFTLTNHHQVMRQINAAPHMEQSTDTAAALDLARTKVFTARSGYRGGKKIAIIITDGCSNDMYETARAAEQLIDSGVLTLAVGVGDVNRTELEYIATLPEDVYMVDNYSVLQTIQDELANKTCKLVVNERCSRAQQRFLVKTADPQSVTSSVLGNINLALTTIYNTCNWAVLKETRQDNNTETPTSSTSTGESNVTDGSKSNVSVGSNQPVGMSSHCEYLSNLSVDNCYLLEDNYNSSNSQNCKLVAESKPAVGENTTQLALQTGLNLTSVLSAPRKIVKKGRPSSKKQKKRQREKRKHGVQHLQTKEIPDPTHTGCDTEQRLHSQNMVLVCEQINKLYSSTVSPCNPKFETTHETFNSPCTMTRVFGRLISYSEDENCFEADDDSCFFTPALSLDILFCKKPTAGSQAAVDLQEPTFDLLDDMSSDENVDLLPSSHGLDSESLKKINALWNENYPTAGFRSCSSGSTDEIQHPTIKVNFAADPHLLTVHIVGTEERNGNWHHVIRERENFERCILELEQILTPVLGASHRIKVLEQRKGQEQL